MTFPDAQRSQQAARPTAAMFRTWWARARRRERLEHHRGYLGDRSNQETCAPQGPERRRPAAVAAHASALAGLGKLDLVQERHGDADYSYWAVVRASSPSVVARMRLRAIAAKDKFAIADMADAQAGAPHHPELSMAAHLLEREEAVQ